MKLRSKPSDGTQLSQLMSNGDGASVIGSGGMTVETPVIVINKMKTPLNWPEMFEIE